MRRAGDSGGSRRFLGLPLGVEIGIPSAGRLSVSCADPVLPLLRVRRSRAGRRNSADIDQIVLRDCETAGQFVEVSDPAARARVGEGRAGD
jgi:hypothetical protein